MSNAMVPVDRQAQAMAIFAGGANPFTAASKAEGVSDGVFGRFNGNTGDYLLGDETAEPGQPVAFEFLDAKQSWLGFDPTNRPVRGPEVSFLSGQALPDHPTPDGVRWIKQIVVPVVTMDGTRIIYSAKAEKPTRPIWRLLKAYGEQMGRNRDASGKFKVPVVELGARSFTIQADEPIKVNGQFVMDPATGQPKTQKVPATKYGEDYKIVDWMSEDDIADIVEGALPEEEAEMKVVNHVEEATYEIIPPTVAANLTGTAVPPGARRPRPGQRA